MLIDKIGKNEKIKVSVTCTVYNHRPYIRQTLDSFVNQKTDFEYEIIVHDDASTDGSADIIKGYAEKYPNKIRAILQEENQHSKGKLIDCDFINPLINGRYIATCEGDDYWPDLNKLQKQFDFLEMHEEYSATCGVTRYFDDDDRELCAPLPGEKYTKKDAIEKEFLENPDALIGTNTLMFHSKYVYEEDYIKMKKMSPVVGDILLMMKLFECGKLYVFSDIFQNHRIQTRKDASNYNSIYNVKNKYLHNVFVVNAITNCLKKEHDLHKWINQKTVDYFMYCLKRKYFNEFFECHKMLDEKYRSGLPMIILKELPRIFLNQVKKMDI